MMKLPTAILALFASVALFADEPLTEAQLREKATAFIEAKNSRQQPETTVGDIDRFLSLIADEFVDEHVKFGVTITDKGELREGMIAKMDDEVYFSEITIDEMMLGRNVAFVKYTEHARVKPSHLDKVIEYTSTNLLSLEFNNAGLITHIRRHHGL